MKPVLWFPAMGIPLTISGPLDPSQLLVIVYFRQHSTPLSLFLIQFVQPGPVHRREPDLQHVAGPACPRTLHRRFNTQAKIAREALHDAVPPQGVTFRRPGVWRTPPGRSCPPPIKPITSWWAQHQAWRCNCPSGLPVLRTPHLHPRRSILDSHHPGSHHSRWAKL